MFHLSSLVPPLISNFSKYNLRNANDIQTIDSRTTLYFNSFLPSVIRDWNSLPYGNRNADSLYSFKRQINHDRKNIPKYYYSGLRRYQIIHTRLRTGCSSLNYDLFLKNILDNPLCRCNSGFVENAQHFLLNCRLYREQRIELYDTVSQYCNITLDVLLVLAPLSPIRTIITPGQKKSRVDCCRIDALCFTPLFPTPAPER